MIIHYHKLTPADLKQYREVRLEALKNYPASFGSSYEEESASLKLGFEINIEMQVANKFMVGAFDGEKLIGICGFAQETRLKVKHRGLIIQMYVRQEYQGKKIGLKLLNATIEEAFRLPDVEQIVLGVITTNKGAEKLYQRAGFKEFGVHPNYLKVGDTYFDEKLMVLFRPE
jgi:RimJ/RimL family protein N-acetyltransferase